MANVNFNWDYDQIRPRIQVMTLKLERELKAATKFHALSAITFARNTAPWHDISGNARSGIKADTHYGTTSGNWGIDIYHSVPYGIYLELRWAGRYAVILPTVEHEAPLYFETAKGVVRGALGGGFA